MATSEHTQPAPAGKPDEAAQLISDMLSALENASQGLRQLQGWPDKAEIDEQIVLLQAVNRFVSDTQIGVNGVLDMVKNERS